MNVNTYIPSELELEGVKAAAVQNAAAALVYIRYLENMLKRVRRLADEFEHQVKLLQSEGHSEAAELMKVIAGQVKEASSPLASTSTPQPVQKDKPHGRR